MTTENTPKRRGRPPGSHHKVGKMDEAEREFREQYVVPHPPHITYKLWRDPVYGEIWSVIPNQSSPEITNNWEVYREYNTNITNIVKSRYRTLPRGNLAIDWCTQWGTSTHQLGYSAKRVIGIETNQEAYRVAVRNLANMPDPPSDIQLHLYECNTLTLAGAVSLVSWQDADIIRFGTRSTGSIIQQIHTQIKAHTIVTEYIDSHLTQLMNSLGYEHEKKQLGFKTWHK